QILKRNVSVIIGPCCNLPAVSVGSLANWYDVPYFPWGLATSRVLEDEARFQTPVTLNAGTYALGVALHEVMAQFEWDDFAFVYSTVGDDDKCSVTKEDVEKAISDFNDNIEISFIYEFPNYEITLSEQTRLLSLLKSRARIFAVCLSEELGLKRDFMLSLTDAGMINDEYVIIFVDTRTRGFVTVRDGITKDVWFDRDDRGDGRDEEAKRAFQRVFLLTDVRKMNVNYTRFGEEVIERMKEPPFSCTTECEGKDNELVSVYAGQLHDAVYLYGKALHKSLSEDPHSFRNGTRIVDNTAGSFDGMSGRVRMTINGTRSPDFYFLALNSAFETKQLAIVKVEGNKPTYSPLYASESELWWNREGKSRPLTEPICGFKGDNCPKSWNDQYLGILLGSLGFVILLVVVLIAVAVYIYITKQREKERQDQLWDISNTSLIKARSKAGMESLRSLQSGPSSTSTKLTLESKKDSVNYSFFVYNRDLVCCAKYTVRVNVMEPNRVEMRMLRQVDNDNLNRFLGLVMDGPQLKSVWKYCSRGSLKDVIQTAKVTLDSFFIYSMLRDIINGLFYIHHSDVKLHGNLSSETCLVDERWQVKLSYYGLAWIRCLQKKRKKDLMWTAPELLRSEDTIGSKEGDVYSFGIIASEIITKSTVWDLDNRKERPEEIFYMLKKGGNNPFRPELTLGENIDVNPAMLHLVRDSWSENPSDRPTVDTIRSLLRSMNSGRSDNLMDHVFNMLENYAGSLEEEVESRTRELTEEKKKSDVLLDRMLPRQVADKLKLGQSIEPEMYDTVTIFFSDVVKFTNLAAKCTPLQVVNLLNDLYSIFDGIIDEHDVYKVETIGDGYLCVSGLPHRNGNEHVKEISLMSIAFLASLQSFRVTHLPKERINLRIGMHTGSCVAGVVGMTMPRYCLFGDTVNTASRMESNGKPGHIHLSPEANRLLTTMHPQFRTECRGEVIIKGKGVMETFWLLGEHG
ncbi:hypothetical protein PFISCL1PPCAC_28592, partial [Pristionchus fissidentatus]